MPIFGVILPSLTSCVRQAATRRRLFTQMGVVLAGGHIGSTPSVVTFCTLAQVGLRMKNCEQFAHRIESATVIAGMSSNIWPISTTTCLRLPLIVPRASAGQMRILNYGRVSASFGILVTTSFFDSYPLAIPISFGCGSLREAALTAWPEYCGPGPTNVFRF